MVCIPHSWWWGISQVRHQLLSRRRVHHQCQVAETPIKVSAIDFDQLNSLEQFLRKPRVTSKVNWIISDICYLDFCAKGKRCIPNILNIICVWMLKQKQANNIFSRILSPEGFDVTELDRNWILSCSTLAPISPLCLNVKVKCFEIGSPPIPSPTMVKLNVLDGTREANIKF